MPFWTTEDTRNVILSTLVPGGAALAGLVIYVNDKKTTDWWEKLRKPSWLTPGRMQVCSAVDLSTVAPLGYASYLVFKHGGGLDYNDTRFALALYGGSIASAVATIPIVKKQNLPCLHRNTVLLTLLSAATAVAFYKIHKPAGYWIAPFAIWSAFYSYLTYAIRKENDPVRDL